MPNTAIEAAIVHDYHTLKNTFERLEARMQMYSGYKDYDAYSNSFTHLREIKYRIAKFEELLRRM